VGSHTKRPNCVTAWSNFDVLCRNVATAVKLVLHRWNTYYAMYKLTRLTEQFVSDICI